MICLFHSIHMCFAICITRQLGTYFIYFLSSCLVLYFSTLVFIRSFFCVSSVFLSRSESNFPSLAVNLEFFKDFRTCPKIGRFFVRYLLLTCRVTLLSPMLSVQTFAVLITYAPVLLVWFPTEFLTMSL